MRLDSLAAEDGELARIKCAGSGDAALERVADDGEREDAFVLSDLEFEPVVAFLLKIDPMGGLSDEIGVEGAVGHQNADAKLGVSLIERIGHQSGSDEVDIEALRVEHQESRDGILCAEGGGDQESGEKNRDSHQVSFLSV